MTTVLTNAATHPVDLASGRVLEPGEQAAESPAEPHNAALIRAGQLAVTDDQPEPDAEPAARSRAHKDKEPT